MTISRYRSATDHLLRFLQQRPVRQASQFHTNLAEEFVCYLRQLRVSPNGHGNTACRPLMDKGLRFILECCRTMFNYAAKRRHLSPYAENPFVALEIDRIPVEQVRPIILFSAEQERAFLEACDDWQFPLFLTLILTGMRPGELCHLLLPDDLNLEHKWIRVRNKPRLGWQVKTRNEREIPLMPVLAEVLRYHLGQRQGGLVFRRRTHQDRTGFQKMTSLAMEQDMARRQVSEETRMNRPLTRDEKVRSASKAWRAWGAVREERVRLEFMRITQDIGLAEFTAPKMLRHQFATSLQEGRVDPLIRNELMGHVASGARTAGFGLGMTAVYTHTRPETRREQMETALKSRVAVQVAREWLFRRISAGSTPVD